MTLTEEHATRMLLQVIRQKRAAEFIQQVCWNNDAFTFDPDGTLVILPGDLLSQMFKDDE